MLGPKAWTSKQIKEIQINELIAKGTYKIKQKRIYSKAKQTKSQFLISNRVLRLRELN